MSIHAALSKASYAIGFLLVVSALRADTILHSLCTYPGLPKLGTAHITDNLSVDFFLAAAVIIFSIHVSILCFATQSAPLSSLILSIIGGATCVYLPFIILLERGIEAREQ